MKAIQFLSKLTAEVIELEDAFLINGENLVNGRYSQLFPIDRDKSLDNWFKADYHYFCLYAGKDEEFEFLGEPALSASSKDNDDFAIYFWIIED